MRQPLPSQDFDPSPDTWVYLVRHGETDSNADRRLQGHRDIPLNERGREQARRLRRWLEELAPAAIFTSDLCRSVETAALAAHRTYEPGAMSRSNPEHEFPRVILAPELRERCFGEWEGLTIDEVQERYPELHRQWRRREAGFCPPGGESYHQLSLRVARFLERMEDEYRGERVVVFSHGGTISAAVTHALGGVAETSLPVLYGNTGISALRSSKGVWTIAFLNCACQSDGLLAVPDIRSVSAEESGDQGLLSSLDANRH